MSKKKKKSIIRTTFKIILLLIVAIILAGGIFATIYINRCAKDLPNISRLSYNPEQSSQIFDYEGELITNVYAFENRIYTPLNKISDIAKKAVIAEEDERFYQHGALDYKGIARAFYTNLKYKRIVEGGSTITQQLARSLFLTMEQTSERKIKEAILATELEKKFTKDQILEMYLNEVYFGAGANGIESAAETYFGKHAIELNLAESAMLAGTLKAPSKDNPFINIKAAKEAQKIVLQKMLKNGYITEEELKEAEELELHFVEEKRVNDNMGYVIDYVKEKVAKKFGETMLYSGGLKIYTTIRPELQLAGSEAINKVLTKAEDDGIFPKDKRNSKDVIQPQAALTALNTKTGAILAMIGGRDYDNTKFNRSTALKQPGSSFKIFDYTAAISSGSITPSSIILSAQYKVDDWEPHEWIGEDKYFGDMTVNQALAQSSNICATKTSLRVGLDRVIYFARKYGITTPLKPYPSAAIGSFEIKQMEMAAAYATLGDSGIYHLPYIIEKIVSPGGQILYEHKDTSYRAVSQETAYLMNKIFTYVMSTEVNAKIKGLPSAAKTGSTDEWTDAWFDGYTPNISVSVVVGPDSQEITFPNVLNAGNRFPAMIWREFMLTAMNEFPKDDFVKPDSGLTTRLVYKDTGYTANLDTTDKDTLYYSFLENVVPHEDIRARGFITVIVCKDSGLLAPPNCPEELTEQRTYIKGMEPTEMDPRKFEETEPPEWQDLQFDLTTDKDVYKIGDYIEMKATVSNAEDLTDLKVTFFMYGFPLATLNPPVEGNTYTFKLIANIEGKATIRAVLKDKEGTTIASEEKDIIIEEKKP